MVIKKQKFKNKEKKKSLCDIDSPVYNLYCEFPDTVYKQYQ